MLTKDSVNEEVKLDPLGGQNLHKELENAAKVCTSQFVILSSNFHHVMYNIFKNNIFML